MKELTVEVACALPDKQKLIRLAVPEGCTAREALQLSGMAGFFPELGLDGYPLGIFGREVSDDRVLVEGDRVEVYRPLANDPREQRRALASKGKNMGRRYTAGD